jgi:hypothetical protein
VLYCVQEYRPPVRSSGVSVQARTQGNSTFGLIEAQGELSERWRGHRMDAIVEAKDSATLADIEPNAKIAAFVNVHDGANYTLYDWTDSVTSIQYTTLFTGYVTPPERGRESGVYKAQGRVNADDIVEARLAKKAVDMQCSFGGNLSNPYDGWTAGNSFRYLLRCAGLSDAQISVDSSVENLPNPIGAAAGSRKLKFRPDTPLPSALDAIADVHGIRWGVDQSNTVFLKPQWSYSGTADYTFDENSTTLEDVATSIRSTRSVRDWRNVIRVMVGEGQDAAVKIIVDESSWSDATASNFIGDIWNAFYAYPDALDVDAIATAIWDELDRYSHLFAWEMVDNPWVMPDETVAVTATSLLSGLSGSIFRVINKSWEIRPDGRFWQRLEGVLVG